MGWGGGGGEWDGTGAVVVARLCWSNKQLFSTAMADLYMIV